MELQDNGSYGSLCCAPVLQVELADAYEQFRWQFELDMKTVLDDDNGMVSTAVLELGRVCMQER